MATTRKITRQFTASIRCRRYANSPPNRRTIHGEIEHPGRGVAPAGILHVLHTLLVEHTADLHSIEALTFTLGPGK